MPALGFVRSNQKRAPPGGRGARVGHKDRAESRSLPQISVAIVAVRHSAAGSLRSVQLRQQVLGGGRMARVAVLIINVAKMTRPAARSAGIPARHHVVRSAFSVAVVIAMIAIAIIPIVAVAVVIPSIAVAADFARVTMVCHYRRRTHVVPIARLVASHWRRCGVPSLIAGAALIARLVASAALIARLVASAALIA